MPTSMRLNLPSGTTQPMSHSQSGKKVTTRNALFIPIAYYNCTSIPSLPTHPDPPYRKSSASSPKRRTPNIESQSPNSPNTIHMVPIIPQLAIRKQLTRPNKITQLRDRLLWIIPFCSVEVTPEHTPEPMRTVSHAEGSGGWEGTRGYPSGLSKIRAYASGLKLGGTQLSSAWPGC